MLVNSENKKVEYKSHFYILHAVFLVVILLMLITIICYHYAKHWSKQKSIDVRTKLFSISK